MKQSVSIQNILYSFEIYMKHLGQKLYLCDLHISNLNIEVTFEKCFRHTKITQYYVQECFYLNTNTLIYSLNK